MSTTSYRSPNAVPLPLTERPTGEAALYPFGRHLVKPFDKLAPPVKELVLSGGVTVGTAPLTLKPLTRAELVREEACLEREAAVIARRLRQVKTELLNLSA